VAIPDVLQLRTQMRITAEDARCINRNMYMRKTDTATHLEKIVCSHRRYAVERCRLWCCGCTGYNIADIQIAT
jgi:hypothetical protein